MGVVLQVSAGLGDLCRRGAGVLCTMGLKVEFLQKREIFRFFYNKIESEQFD